MVLWYLTHIPWWILALFTLVIQFLGFYAYQTAVVAYYGIQARKIEADMLKELSYQTVEIECPCSLKCKQNVNLRLNEDTQYECIQCQKKLNVVVDVSSLLATNPVKTDIETFDELLKKAKEKAEKQS
jgi:hypothetical protein